MTTAAGALAADGAPEGAPTGHGAPRATVDPDGSKSWLRRALPIVRAHRGTFVAALVLSFAGLVVQVQVPQLLNQAISDGVVRHVVPLSHYAWWVAGLGLAGGVIGFASRLLLFRTAYGMEYDLRNVVYEHLNRLSFPFYDRVQAGQLISRANSDIRSVHLYLTFAPLILVQSAIAVVAFGYMLAIDAPLALVAMVTMPFVYVIGRKMRSSMFPVSWLIQARLADVATVVDENVNGVRVVKSFAAEEGQLRSLATAARRVQWATVKDADLRSRWAPAMQNLPQVGLVLVLLFGGYLVIQGRLGVGAILAFNAYLLMLQAPFTMLGMLIMMGQRAAASAGRIYELLDEEPTVVDRPGAVELARCRGGIDVDDVRFAYGDGTAPPVLDGFTLHVAPGETVALVGATGSGKSTVARLLTRCYDVDAGAVRIDGNDVRDLTLASLRRNVGVVLDEPFLFSASIADNIAYGDPGASRERIVAAAVAAGADGFVRELPAGYDTVVGERGYTLSGGQRQRVAIARTLLVNPPILVLDDATSAVDVQVELQIHQALRQLMAGRTTVLIAHRLSTIALADRVVLLDGGRVAAEGTHAELLAATPRYAEVLAQAEDRAAPDAAGAVAGAAAGAGAGAAAGAGAGPGGRQR